MANLPRRSRVSQASSTSASHSEHQPGEPTENEPFILDEAQAFPSLKDEHGHPSISLKDHITRKPVSPEDTTSESIASIVGGFVAGVALAISHHIFLTFLNGRNINEYPQYWVKNANNAFSAVFSLCIAFVATSALTQMKWNAARSKPLTIRSIDNLFALPSPLALFTTVTSTRLSSLRLFFFPISTAIFIQSVALVSIFAPNALTVAPSAEISQDILVPTLDLSQGPFDSIPNSSYEPYANVSQLWSQRLTSIMLQPPIVHWKIPPGCGATCKFDLVYDGPGLQCMETPLDTMPYTGGGHAPIYNATSTLYPSPGHDPSSFWEIKDQYELQIIYDSFNDNGHDIWHDYGSVRCMFRNATYKASFQMENNTMQVNHGIQSYGAILGTVTYDPESSCTWNQTEPCYINGVNTRAMCEVFASTLTGKIQFASVGLSESTGGVNVAILDSFFSHVPNYVTIDFHLEVSNLSESLVSLFSDLTLGFIPYRDDNTKVRAEIWDGSYAWSYTTWVLWAVYLPTLLLASLMIINGLLSIQSNKRGIDDKFSNFLLATRNTELDYVCMEAEDFAELQQLRLLYQREKGTFSVASAGDYTKWWGGGEDAGVISDTLNIKQSSEESLKSIHFPSYFVHLYSQHTEMTMVIVTEIVTTSFTHRIGD